MLQFMDDLVSIDWLLICFWQFEIKIEDWINIVQGEIGWTIMQSMQFAIAGKILKKSE